MVEIILEKMTGRPSAKGKPLSEEHKEKLRLVMPEVLKGIKKTETHKKNTSEAIKKWWKDRKCAGIV